MGGATAHGVRLVKRVQKTNPEIGLRLWGNQDCLELDTEQLRFVNG